MYTLFLRYTIDPNKLSTGAPMPRRSSNPLRRVEAASPDTMLPPSSPAPPAKRLPPLMSAPWPNMRYIARSLPRTPGTWKMSAKSRRLVRSIPYIAPLFGGSSRERPRDEPAGFRPAVVDPGL